MAVHGPGERAWLAGGPAAAGRRESVWRRVCGMGLWLVLAVGVACAQTSGIRTDVELRQAPGAGRPLVVAIRMSVPAGMHVYRSEERFFQIQERRAQHVGPMQVQLPPVQAIPDALSDTPGATVDVFAGNPEIVVTRAAAAPDGETWAFQGVLSYQACSETTCYPPEDVPFSFAGVLGTAGSGGPGRPLAGGSRAGAAARARGLGELGVPGRAGLLWGALGALGAGLLLGLTPCVYPMVGITVAVIGGQRASRRRALWLTFLYVLGLALAYALLGVAVARLGAPVAAFLRSPWVLGPVGLFFALLGLSMFDVYTLQTPPALAARLQGIGAQGGALGAMAMGAASALVMGPCVSGPVFGLITYVATTGDVVTGFVHFFALAWGMGLPLFVAGSVAGLLPKAGPWMEHVKHVLGMVLIASGFYFARPVVGEAVFLAGTLACAVVTIAVLGLLDLPRPGAGRPAVLRFLAGATLVFVVLLGAAAAWVRPAGDGPGAARRRVDVEAELAAGHPVILDFWAPWCANCKVIERTVLADPAVRAVLHGYNLVKVAYDANRDLAARYGVVGPPGFVFLDPAGRALGPPTVTGEDLRHRLLAERRP